MVVTPVSIVNTNIRCSNIERLYLTTRRYQYQFRSFVRHKPTCERTVNACRNEQPEKNAGKLLFDFPRRNIFEM